ncbi:MAG: hypothetical protein PW792_01500 [Acidobacteriaceae bacterium]|nr:hypothetical protein [Acidobacteriaceae bacterium]
MDWFLDVMPIDVPEGCRLSIFEEPRIESGFPDLVLVIWDESVTEAWHHSRKALKAVDLSVLHCLYQMKRATGFEIEKLLACSVDESLERLAAADMIDIRKGSCSVKPLREIFAVRRIIAIEAKVSAVSSGMHQAALNTWFAHDSILLLPEEPQHLQTGSRAEDMGISIFARAVGNVLKPASSFEKPVSYASWLFNEWAWKATL